MVKQSDKEVLRQLSMEFISLKSDEKEQNEAFKKKLKEDADYQALITQKKQIMEQLKAREEEIAMEEIKELEVTKSNIKMIKEDFKTKLEVNPTVVSDLLNYRYKDHEKPEEKILDAVSTVYVELYDLD